MLQLLKHPGIMLPLLALLLVTQPSVASTRPDWLVHPIQQDATHKYYIGRSSQAANEAEAFEAAMKDAYESAIRENFGFRTQVQETNYSDATSTQSTKRVDQKSHRVELHEFEQLETYHEEDDEKHFNAWVLCKYSKAAIQKEIERLAHVDDKTKESPWPDDEPQTLTPQGSIEITSDPAGAEIYIDESHWGTTPMRVVGGISPGRHTVRLDHPTHKAIQEDLILRAGKKTRVHRLLQPAQGKVKISSEPAHAKVRINGVPRGTTPIRDLSFQAGSRLIIELTHPDAERYLQEVEIIKDVTRELDLKLQLHPAYVKVKTDPNDASLIWDGSPITPQNGWLGVTSGKHQLRVEKVGYNSHEQQISLKPREKRELAPISLSRQQQDLSYLNNAWRSPAGSWGTTSTQSSDQPQWVKDRAGYSDWIFGFWIGYHGTDIVHSAARDYLTLGFSLEKQFAGIIGLKALINYDDSVSYGGGGPYDNSSGYSNSSYRYTGTTYRLSGWTFVGALPIYLVHTDDSALYLQGFLGVSHHTFEGESTYVYTSSSYYGCYYYCDSYSGNSYSGTSYSGSSTIEQSVYGAALGYQGFANHSSFGWSFELGTSQSGSAGSVNGNSAFYFGLGLLIRGN